jgi:Fe-S cluster biogenesis protein NfuA
MLKMTGTCNTHAEDDWDMQRARTHTVKVTGTCDTCLRCEMPIKFQMENFILNLISDAVSIETISVG